MPDIHHLVYAIGGNKQHHVSIDYLLEVVEHQIRRRYYHDVAHHDDPAKGYVAILVHYRRHDVGTSRGTVERETHANATATEDGSYETCHERLVGKQVERARVASGESGQGRKHKHGIDGLGAKLPTKNLQRHEQEGGVYYEIRCLHGNVHSPEEKRRHTWHATRSDVVGQEKHVPTDTVRHHGHGYHDVVAHFVNYFSTDFH